MKLNSLSKQKISLILPIRNEEDYIKRTLTSIIEKNEFNKNIELIIIDGMSTDRTQDIVQTFIANNEDIDIYLLENIYKTVPYAMNIGIKQAKGDFIIRLDAHSIYPDNYISSLIYWMNKLNADNVGGIVNTIPVNNKFESIAISQAVSNSFGVGNSKFRTVESGNPMEVDTVPFGCYKKEIFDQIGLYDTDLTRNQDDELNARLIQNGGKIFLIPDIKIKYYARDSYSKVSSMFYQYGYFKPLVNLKLKSAATVRQFIPLIFVLYIILGGLASLVDIRLFYLFIVGLMIYSSVNFYVSYKISKRLSTLLLLPYLYKSFLIIHLSYGIGYLKGIVDFLILKKYKKENLSKIDISR